MIRLVAIGFGALLVLALIVLVFFYFSPRRKAKVETPKYRMLEDEDDTNTDKNA